MRTLPVSSKLRVQYPISSGCLAYFPAALAGVARHSYIGGAKYNDGALVHLRYISTQHLDCVGRHLIDLQELLAAKERGEQDVNVFIYDFEEKREILQTISIEEAILIEANALAWRALATSQELHEKWGHCPLAPAARLEPAQSKVTFKLLSFGNNKVGAVKCIRAVMGLPLKESVDMVNNLPATIDVTSSKYSLHDAMTLFVNNGAIVE